MKHYLQFNDLTADEYTYLFERAALIKKKFKAYEKHQPVGRQRGAPDHRRQPAGPRRAD
jgi:hypothetical protein